MVKWICCFCLLLFSMFTALTSCSSDLQSGLGMAIEPRSKRPLNEPEDHRQMVTIDLSALRPSLPGLVLYNYGEQAPKLVQVDLSALNPQLQPHVIWPQFDQMELFSDKSFNFDDIDSIPYLTDDESLMSSKPRVAKMMMASNEDASWPSLEGLSDGDIYDFIPNSRRNDEMRNLKSSLPVADEVIVPLDWEEEKTTRNSEKTNRNSEKRSFLLPRGWRTGLRGTETTKANSGTSTAMSQPETSLQSSPSGSISWSPRKKKHNSEIETEEKDDTQASQISQPGKKNVFISSGWAPGGQQVSAMAAARRRASRRKLSNQLQPQSSARVSGQEAWSLPRQYWSVPHFLDGHWQ